MWRKNYPYLNNEEFLQEIDTQHLQDQYLKITLLDWEENPIQEIQGMATGGSISINGNSSVRRTCSLTMSITDEENAAISSVKNLISIGKKIFLEIGILNRTDKYKEAYPIIWFPQGYYVFTQCSITDNVNGGTILSAQLKDKMCLLNGECGGILPSTVQFDVWNTVDADGNWTTEKVTMSQIIKEAVNHWGKEQLGKIIISDLDEKVKKVMRWIGDSPVYLINNQGNYYFTMDETTEGGVRTFNYGDDLGFTYTDFTYPSELIANPGDNICTAVLDKIKNALGNYEYFYDVYGNFVFQEIKNYLNTTQATIDIRNMSNDDYKIDISKGKSVYDFTNNELAISFNNAPQYSRIKNDFVIWGTRESTEGVKRAIRYHLAIDKKPKVGKIFDVYLYPDPEDGLIKAKVPIDFDSKEDFPTEGNIDVFYLDKTTGLTYKWDAATKSYVSPSGLPCEEYDSIEQFPREPDIGTIYVDKTTCLQYMWKTFAGAHYDEVQTEIDELTAEHEAEIAALEEDIAEYQSQLVDIDQQIIDLDNEFATELFDYNQADTNYNAMIDNIQYCNDKIAENNTLIANYAGLVTYYNELYSDLMTQYMSETDPDKRSQLKKQADEAQEKAIAAAAAQQALITENEELTAQISEDETNKTYWENKRTSAEAILESVGYYRRLDSLENAYDAIELLIKEAQEQIDELNKDYDEDLEDLLYKQKQYVQVMDDATVKVQATDWRTTLYLQGAAAEALGLESNYYYTELKNEWPKIYNITADFYRDDDGNKIYTGAFYEEVKDYPWDLDYWLDFIDSEAKLGELNVSSIGRRSLSENKDDYNCLFEPEIPDFILIESGQPDTEEKREECEARAQKYIQVDSEIYNLIATGGMRNSCFERVKNALYDYTSYNSNITIGCLPIYHLDVNQRITLSNKQNDIFGDYLINSISIPLTIEGTMNISATQCNAKL